MIKPDDARNWKASTRNYRHAWLTIDATLPGQLRCKEGWRIHLTNPGIGAGLCLTGYIIMV